MKRSEPIQPVRNYRIIMFRLSLAKRVHRITFPNMETRSIIFVLLFLSMHASVGGFLPVSTTTVRYPSGKLLGKCNKDINDFHCKFTHQISRKAMKYFCLQGRSSYDDDDDSMDDDEIEEWYRKLSRNSRYNDDEDRNNNESQSELLQTRIKNGNYLDLLSLSVVIFFLATMWITGGRLLSVEATNFNQDSKNNSGKTRVYKYVDADKLLQEEFQKEPSTVRF